MLRRRFMCLLTLVSTFWVWGHFAAGTAVAQVGGIDRGDRPIADAGGPVVQRPAITASYPHVIELRGLIALEGTRDVRALLEINSTLVFLRLGERRALPGGGPGEVLLAEISDSEQLHLHFPGMYRQVVMTDRYNPTGP